jgi:hypothetical protein
MKADEMFQKKEVRNFFSRVAGKAPTLIREMLTT